MKRATVGLILIVLLFGVWFMNTDKMVENKKVKFETNQGDILIEIYSEKMPITAGNFEKLVSEGFYDGVIFHRIIEGFMIQGGDPMELEWAVLVIL